MYSTSPLPYLTGLAFQALPELGYLVLPSSTTSGTAKFPEWGWTVDSGEALEIGRLGVFVSGCGESGIDRSSASDVDASRWTMVPRKWLNLICMRGLICKLVVSNERGLWLYSRTCRW